jgi:hypothetical protein
MTKRNRTKEKNNDLQGRKDWRYQRDNSETVSRRKMGQTMIYKEEKIDDTKGIFRSRKSTENGTNNDLQERKDWRYQRDIQKPKVEGK